jgi:alanyl aminopeptidase
VDPRETEFTGSVSVELDVTRSTASLRLHAEDMAIDRVELRGPAGDVPVEVERLADDLIALNAGADLPPGAYHLSIDYSSPFNTQAVGLYRMERDGEAYAFSQFESVDARKAFPCWDEPAFKIPFQLTLTVPDGYLALSNTPEGQVTEDAGWKTIRFESTPPLPTYLIAIVVGHFDVVEIPGLGVPGRVVVPRGDAGLAGAAVENTPPILAALEEWFGSPYPFRKLDLIAVPEFWPGAMEHPGAITYRDTVLLLDPAATSIQQHRTLVRYTAHELAHQWFGNLVTMEWWDDLWLNEAFADWMGDKITNQLHPEFALPSQELGQTQAVMSADARASAKPIRAEVNPGDSMMEGVGVAYLKGKLVLSQFEEWIGPASFRQGLVDYLERHARGNASASDLWQSLDAASGRDLSAAMRSYLDQPGLPLVSVERLDGGRVKLSQRRFSSYGADLEPCEWSIPVVLQWGDAGGTKRRTVLLDEAESVVELPTEGEPTWIHPNGSARGYYRWTLPAPELARLARAASTELSVLERREFLGNAGALLDAGVLQGDDYLDVLHGFAADPSPEVVSGLRAGLAELRITFGTPETDASIALLGRRLLRPALDRIGWETVPGEPETVAGLRSELIRALGGWCEDAEVVERCRGIVRASLADSVALDPNLQGAALWVAARDGDAALWEAYRERFETATVPADRSRFLAALGGFRDPELRQRSLDYVFTGPLQTQELFVIPRSASEGEEAIDIVTDWSLAHWDDWVGLLPRASLGRLAGLGRGCSEDRRARVEAFFADPDHRIPNQESRLQRMSEQVADCTELRAREGDRVADWLARYAAAPRASVE